MINFQQKWRHDNWRQYIFQTKIDKINGIKCKLKILDTEVQDDYQIMLDTLILAEDVFILFYLIDDKDSFEQIKLKNERII